MSASTPAAIGRVVLTGASGLVGRVLRERIDGSLATVSLGRADWLERLEAAPYQDAVVIHLAARVPEGGSADESLYMRDNAEKTRVLAERAARGGARRLVFLSTIKVNGSETSTRAFRADDSPQAAGPYARSKLAAERALGEIAGSTRLEVAIVRSPLIFGRGVKGNLRAIIRLADTPMPLPFAALDNRRSFVHVDDLAILLLACAVRPQAAGRVFLAAHSDSYSTSRLVVALRQHLGRPSRLFGVEPRTLEALGAALGQSDRMRSLTRSLEADASETRAVLGWEPRVSFDAALGDAVSGCGPST